MIKIPSAQQFRELDQQTILEQQISSYDLMERASAAMVRQITSLWPHSDRTSFAIFAGPGNNGGDALATARFLSNKGYAVSAYLFNIGGKLSSDCETNRDRLSECSGIKFTEITAQFEPPQFGPDTIVVDGLFGTGLKAPLSGGFASLVKFINRSASTVISIDIPSGLMCDGLSGIPQSAIVRATHTFTFQLPKKSMYFAESQEYIGHLHIVDIQLSQKATEALQSAASELELSDISQLIRPRAPFGHKGTFGHGLLIAGKYGMAGSSILAAQACLRSGIGKITVHTPNINNSILQIAVPEAVLDHDVADNIFTTRVDATPYNAVAIGPGIGTDQITALAFIEQVRSTHAPLIIDADGINILSEHPNWINELPAGSILTPHPGEWARLLQKKADSATALAEAESLAVKKHLYIILKGHRTAICTPEGKTYFNSTGNSGMATAGSGDVLTGILLSLLAQGYSRETACCLGTYLHGLSGDLAAAQTGEESLIASDLIRFLPQAFQYLKTVIREINN